MLDSVRDVVDHRTRRLEGHVIAARGERVGYAVGELLAAHVDERIVQHLAVSVYRRAQVRPSSSGYMGKTSLTG